MTVAELIRELEKHDLADTVYVEPLTRELIIDDPDGNLTGSLTLEPAAAS